jgi:pimeloyl-ACP methyl ester carboxylesterase
MLATSRRRALLEHPAPTLVIHGADPLVPVARVDTAKSIRGAQLKVIPGMGHDFAPALLPLIADSIASHVRAVQVGAPPAAHI